MNNIAIKGMDALILSQWTRTSSRDSAFGFHVPGGDLWRGREMQIATPRRDSFRTVKNSARKEAFSWIGNKNFRDRLRLIELCRCIAGMKR
jgi:hypothetical protein